MNLIKKLKNLFTFNPDVEGEIRYKILKRNLVAIMLTVTFTPLLIMAFINYIEFKKTMSKEIISPMHAIVAKAKHSMELFLAERLAILNFVSKAYSYEELSRPEKLIEVFSTMKSELRGFVDIGVIDHHGIQINYVGPYDLMRKDYSQQSWFQEVIIKGSYVSDVFMGYRKFPHMVIAVENSLKSGTSWILRATIDTDLLNSILQSMSLDQEGDAFLINKDGVLQTPSKYYGSVLNKIPFKIPPISYQPTVTEIEDNSGNVFFMTYVYLAHPNLILILSKPYHGVLRAWTALKSEILALFIGGTFLIIFVVIKVTDIFVTKLKESDEKREAAFRELQHHHKLSSLGRLAAGVAHEINNPLAIINEKAGLILDLLPNLPKHQYNNKLETLTKEIVKSVKRCKNITHRLLGFAKRIDVQLEKIDINDLIKEVLTFIEKEALYKNIDLQLDLDESVPTIISDRGQLQQVFLNILNNAFDAISEGGIVEIKSEHKDHNFIAVSIKDNGHGMDEETIKHIFEPFFTTKKIYGTGLGMPITYGIIKKLGGDIQVKSEVGKGTIFTVYIPIKSSTISQ